MRARLAPLLLSLVAMAVGLVPATASAAVYQPRTATSGTGAVTIAADGSTWIVETFTGSVARFSAEGALLGRWPVGNEPEGIAAGPGGRVWVSVAGDRKLVWFDALTAAPTPHPVSTSGLSTCGPSTIVDGGNGKMYFSLPNTSGCVTGSHLGQIAADGSGAPADLTHDAGTVYGLVMAGGKLYAASFSDDRIYRISPSGAIETTIEAPAGSGLEGIAVDARGTLWAAAFNTGQVVTAPVTLNNGKTVTANIPAGKLVEPSSVAVTKSGNVYVAGSGSANLLKIAPNGAATSYPVPEAGARPFGLAVAPDGSLAVSNQASTSFFRFVNGAPAIGTTAADPTGSSAAIASSVDPGGNDTAVSVEYGLTSAYGQSAPLGAVPTGTLPVGVSGVLAGLAPATTYHARVVATSSEGVTLGPDVAFTTLAAPAPAPAPNIGPVTLSPVGLVSLSKRSFKTTGKHPGTTITITIQGSAGQTAKATADVSLQAKGVTKTKGGRCVAPPKKKAKGQASCVRLIPKGTIDFGTLPLGPTTRPFDGKLRGKRLAPGKYTLAVLVGISIRSATFTIKR